MPDMIVASLDGPLVELRLHLDLFFNMIIDVRPGTLNLVVTPTRLFNLRCISRNVRAFAGSSHLNCYAHSPVRLIHLFNVSGRLTNRRVPQHPRNIRPHHHRTSTQTSFNPVSTRGCLRAARHTQGSGATRQRLPQDTNYNLLRHQTQIRHILRSHHTPRHTRTVRQHGHQRLMGPVTHTQPQAHTRITSTCSRPDLLNIRPPGAHVKQHYAGDGRWPEITPRLRCTW